MKISPHLHAFTDEIAVINHCALHAAWPAKGLKYRELGEDTVHREHRRSHARGTGEDGDEATNPGRSRRLVRSAQDSIGLGPGTLFSYLPVCAGGG